MKFFLLVFLGVCAFTLPTLAQQEVEKQPENLDLAEVTKQLIEFIKKCIDDLQIIRARAREIVADLADKIQKLYEEIDRRVGELMKEFERIMKDLENEGVEAKKCIQKYLPKIKEARERSQKGMKRCADSAAAEMEVIREQLRNQGLEIQRVIGYIVKSAKDCLSSNNPIKIILCLNTEIPKIQKQVEDVIESTKNAIDDAAERLKDIPPKFQRCQGIVISKSREELLEIIQSIRQCIENN